jgi:hypothetical protein
MAMTQTQSIGSLYTHQAINLRRYLPGILVAAVFIAVILFAALNRTSASDANAYTSYQSTLPAVHAAKPSPLHPITAHTPRTRVNR